MGKEYPEIDARIGDWIKRQKMFFVATAPIAPDGLVNCSPKGMNTFRVLGPRTIAYLDLTGSGIETISHIRENQRITIMMCAFDGPHKTFRFYGKGEVFEEGSPGYQELISEFDELPGARSIIKVNLDRIIDSCGYSTPLYDYAGERDTLTKWAENKGADGIKEYQCEANQTNLDGMPGLESLDQAIVPD